jgi:hypothetical protein
MIPEHRRVLTIHGEMGCGKTRMAAIIAGELSRREGLPVLLYYMKGKEETTLPFYDKFCSGYTARTGIGYNTLTSHSLSNSIVCIEDAPTFIQSKTRRNCVVRLVTCYARQDNIPTIMTTQKSIGIPTGLKMEMDRMGKDCEFRYRLSESRRTLGWKDCTNISAVEDITKAFYDGISGRGEAGHVGRKIREDSFQHQCFLMFDQGLPPKQICETQHFASGSSEYQKVHVYYGRWKLRVNQLLKN